MDISKFLGDNSYRILIAATLFSIINLPIQFVQLILLGKLTFPTITLFQLPWYVIMFGGVSSGVLALWCVGYIMERFHVAKAQNNISNLNNPQIQEILKRLENIEKKL